MHRIVLVIILQFSLGSLQGCYATEDSRQHLGVLCLLFSSFVATALIELALIVTGLQGMGIKYICQGSLVGWHKVALSHSALEQINQTLEIERCGILQVLPWR